MTRSAPSLIRHLAPLLVLVLVPLAPGAEASDFDHESLFDAFYKTGLDASKAYAVADLTIQKDNMKLRLKKGTVFLMKPIAGEVTGAVFLGEGVASMTPPNRTERYCLGRYYGATRLNEPFDQAVFRFSDDTEELIVAEAEGSEPDAELLREAEEVFEERSAIMDRIRYLQLENRLLEIRLSDLEGLDFFFAEFHSSEHDWLSYVYDPQWSVEHALFSTETLGAEDQRLPIPWTVWHELSDYGPKGHYIKNPNQDGPTLLRVKHNEMDLNFKTLKGVEFEARLLIEPRIDYLNALLFDLVNNARSQNRWDDDSFYPVRVSSVADGSGRDLPYSHKKDQLLVFLHRPVEAGTPITLVVKGNAEVVVQLTAESFGLSQASWYPQYGFLGGRSSFNWTVRVPRPYIITGSGKVIREFEDKENRQNGIVFGTDQQVHFPWVIFGRFQKAEDTYIGAETGTRLPITIHSFPNMTVPITDKQILDYLGLTRPVTLELTAPMRKVKAFFEEGKEVLKLYENIYGPFPYEELHIAQMAPFMGFGQSPQGFVQLTGEAFMSQAQLESDFFHGFYAHEIAHQWWAHQIGWASEKDEWLSEAFAEYAAGIFVNEFQGPKRFQRKLDEWRENALISDGAAPIAGANTLFGPGRSHHRTNLLYNKGPYVLHMLRVQLDDQKYSEVMKSIQETYKNRDITTELMIREINRVTKSDYTYFFDQWFWDVGIPTFRYSWRSQKQSDGKHLITVHISQDDAKHLKRVLMPIHIHFKDNTIPQYRPVTEVEQDIKILSPEKPRDVTLDDDRTLLAKIERN